MSRHEQLDNEYNPYIFTRHLDGPKAEQGNYPEEGCIVPQAPYKQRGRELSFTIPPAVHFYVLSTSGRTFGIGMKEAIGGIMDKGQASEVVQLPRLEMNIPPIGVIIWPGYEPYECTLNIPPGSRAITKKDLASALARFVENFVSRAIAGNVDRSRTEGPSKDWVTMVERRRGKQEQELQTAETMGRLRLLGFWHEVPDKFQPLLWRDS